MISDSTDTTACIENPICETVRAAQARRPSGFWPIGRTLPTRRLSDDLPPPAQPRRGSGSLPGRVHSGHAQNRSTPRRSLFWKLVAFDRGGGWRSIGRCAARRPFSCDVDLLDSGRVEAITPLVTMLARERNEQVHQGLRRLRSLDRQTPHGLLSRRQQLSRDEPAVCLPGRHDQAASARRSKATRQGIGNDWGVG